MTAAPTTIGVVGAGTMGVGIAELACAAGAITWLHDDRPETLERGCQRVAGGLTRAVGQGRLTEAEATAAGARLRRAEALEALAGCELVIEAATEDLELKRALVASLSRLAPSAVVASNTSSLSVTAIAAAATDPSRVVGLHFFNPAPAMALVEVVAGVETGPEALAVAHATAAAMGKRAITVPDGPGFLVNRCNRPFALEALRLRQEGIAELEAIDRICRLGGGFAMGPFELQDLVGLDVSHRVAVSLFEQSFGEPRWRPSPLLAAQVAAGRLGRKAGRGWYVHPHPPAVEPGVPITGGGADRLLVLAGERAVALELHELAADAGFDVRRPEDAVGEVPWLIVDGGGDGLGVPAQGGPIALLLADGSLHALDPGGGSVGFHALAPLRPGGLVELTASPTTTRLATERLVELLAALGLRSAWVGDAPGLVLGRIVAQLVNEAAFAVAEGIASAADVDEAMVLGLRHPRGPFAWAQATGADHLVAVLDALHHELGEERYRVAPLLRRLALEP